MATITKKSREQREAEAEVEDFRRDLGPFVVAADVTRMPMIFTDAKEAGNPIIFANDSFLKLTGYGREEILAKTFNFLMARSDDLTVLTGIQQEFEGVSENGSDHCYLRKDGSEFWATTCICPVKDKSGIVLQHFASFVDLTKHKEEQDHCKMLVDELNHRVKNTLSAVQSIAWQALRNSTDPEDIRESIESRLFALSRSHDLLTRQDWKGAGLQDLIEEALAPFDIAGDRTERLTITGESIVISPKTTLALGIAFHELAANAVKYGAYSNEVGSIQIAWAIESAPGGDRLILHWQEKGGPPVTPPIRRGFGSQVIEHGLSHELEGTVQLAFPPDGVSCTINIPAPRGAHDV